MYTYPCCLSICYFTGSSEESSRELEVDPKKRKVDRPPNVRTSSRTTSQKLKPAYARAQDEPGGSGSAQKLQTMGGKGKKHGKGNLGPVEEEEVPDENIYDMGVPAWRKIRRKNTYRFKERTYKDFHYIDVALKMMDCLILCLCKWTSALTLFVSFTAQSTSTMTHVAL